MNTKNFTVIFKDSHYRAYQSCKFNVGMNELILDKLADALYMAQELTPMESNWKALLARYSECFFTYHNTEFVKVHYLWRNDNCIFEAIDVAF